MQKGQYDSPATRLCLVYTLVFYLELLLCCPTYYIEWILTLAYDKRPCVLLLSRNPASPTPSSDANSGTMPKWVFDVSRVSSNKKTSEAGVYLSGTFAKLHYLFQDRKVDEEQIYIGLNDYRVRMGNLSSTRDEVLQADFAYDMLRLARLVAWRKQVPLPIQLKERLPQLLPELKHRKGHFAGDFRVVVLEKRDDFLLVYCVNEE